MGQINQLLWPVETSGETRAPGKEEVGWRRGGGMCGVTLGLGGRGKQGEEGKGEQRSEPAHLAAGCYGLEELHLRVFARPEVRGIARQVHSFEGAHWM